MEAAAAMRNGKTVDFNEWQQGRVNHSAQRAVKHSACRSAQRVPLTSPVKPILKGLLQAPRLRGPQKARRERVVRCQTELGGAAGSGRDLRLDPLALPARFITPDECADGRTRTVELHRERIVLRRALRGIKMALNVPVSAYRGVAIRMERIEVGRHRMVLTLEHRDPGLSVPLFAAFDADDIVAEWQLWSRVLALPLLVIDTDGQVREPLPRMGGVRIAAPATRRRRRTALRKRRPRIVFRRRAARIAPDAQVHRGEREIIARN